ncbi:MAG: hypothetical protein PW734_08200 [Verrucomicrobium sp.]|nr:hypothetical protein [Verrucomicrobium sp.]
MLFLRRLRRWFTGSVLAAPAAFRRQTVAWRQSRVIVQLYYAILSYMAISLLPSWNGLIHAREFDPLWPVAWLRHVPQEAGITSILALYIAGAVAAAFMPGSRTARLLAWLGLFQFAAFNNSFGKIGHSLHAWVLTGLVLVFLPGPRSTSRRAARQGYLQVFWLAQAVFMLTYSMAGLGKVAGCIYQFCVGEMTVFNPHSFAYQVAGRLIQTGMDSPVGAWLIHYYWAGWPAYLAMIYIQLFSFWVVFRPALMRPWALALILFHVGSFFIFTILFSPSILLIGLFLVAAPQARPWRLGTGFRRSLPLVGRFLVKCAS